MTPSERCQSELKIGPDFSKNGSPLEIPSGNYWKRENGRRAFLGFVPLACRFRANFFRFSFGKKLVPAQLYARYRIDSVLKSFSKRYRIDSALKSFSTRYPPQLGGAGALMWFAIFEETRSETDQTRREPLFSSMETPVRTLMVRRWSILGNVVAKALDPGLTRKTRCRQRISVFRIFRALPRFKIGLEVARN